MNSIFISPTELLMNACEHEMRIKITKIESKDEGRTQFIQYYYTLGNNNCFLRVTNDRIINGRIGEDDKAYAEGLPINVLKYLIYNFHLVNFNEMSA